MTKKEVQAIFDEVLKMYKQSAIDGFKIERINPVLNFNKTTRVLGLCKYTKWERTMDTINKWRPIYCDIYISEYAIQDKESVYNTLAHEVIHTFDNCQNHGKHFKDVANKVSDKMNINVWTRATLEECEANGINKAIKDKTKYILKCCKCGHEYKYMKKTRAITNYKNYYCTACHSEVGDLKLIEL